MREEWEEAVSREEFQSLLQAGRIPDSCASAVQGIIGEEALIPVLEVRNHRKVRRVTHKERGLVAEMSFSGVRDERTLTCFTKCTWIKPDTT